MLLLFESVLIHSEHNFFLINLCNNVIEYITNKGLSFNYYIYLFIIIIIKKEKERKS